MLKAFYLIHSQLHMNVGLSTTITKIKRKLIEIECSLYFDFDLGPKL